LFSWQSYPAHPRGYSGHMLLGRCFWSRKARMSTHGGFDWHAWKQEEGKDLSLSLSLSLPLSIFFPILFLSSFNKWGRGRQRNACVRFPIVLKEKELVSSTYCTTLRLLNELSPLLLCKRKKQDWRARAMPWNVKKKMKWQFLIFYSRKPHFQKIYFVCSSKRDGNFFPSYQENY